MRGKIIEKSSILLLGRSTVVIGAVVITAISFVLGYFLGYKGGDISDVGKQVAGIAKERETAKEEEKKVLDASPVAAPAEKKAESLQEAPVVVPPPARDAEAVRVPPPASIAEAVTPAEEEEEPAKAPAKAPAKEAGSKKKQLKAAAADKGSSARTAVKETAPKEQPEEREESVGKAPAAKAAGGVTKAARHAKDALKKQAGGTSGHKQYTVQVGAFPGKEGAEHLMQKLKGQGYKPYVVNAGGDDTYYRVRVGTYKDKKEAAKGAAELSKKTGLQNFITVK
jgi:cell division septation protein DedD